MGKAVAEVRSPIKRVASSGERITNHRLSPAEAHNILRQQLGRFAASDESNPEDARYTASRTIIQTYAPGEIVLPAGVRAGCLGLLVQGEIAVYAHRQGGSRRIAILLPGRAFGHEMLEGRPCYATLQALTRCEVWFVQRADPQPEIDPHRAEGPTVPLWYRAGRLAMWLAVVLALFLTLGMPSTRQAWAQVPMGLGQWCSHEGYERCAERAWMVAAVLASEDVNPRLALGTLYAGQGQLEAAERSFVAADVLAPDLPEVYNNMGVIYGERGEYERAVLALRRALELEPGVAAVEHNLGRSLQALQAYDEALAHYQSALALGAPQAVTLVNMAITYYEAGDLTRAEETAQEALHYDETRVPAHTVLGAVALESQQPDKALAHLRQAVALDPRYGPALFYLGLTYEVLDRPASAIATLEQALEVTVDEDLGGRIRQNLGALQKVEGLDE